MGTTITFSQEIRMTDNKKSRYLIL
jgi:hypothetical protein